MVTYTAYVFITLTAVCLATAWPQYRSSQPTNANQEDVDRIVWRNEDRTYMQPFASPTNSPRASGTKPNTRRPQRLQGGFLLDQDNDTRPQQNRRNGQSGHGVQADGMDYTRRQRQQQQQQQQRTSSQAGRETQEEMRQQVGRNSRMDQVNDTRQHPNRTGVRGNSRGHSSQQPSVQPRAHQTPTNQSKPAGVEAGRTAGQSGGSGRVAGNTTLREREHEARGLTNTSSTRVKMPNESIVFPEASREDQDRFIPRVEGERPRCADTGETFCTDTLPDYPIEYLNRVLDQQGVVFRNFFTTDVVPEANNIAQRFDDTQDDRPMCLSEAQVVYPKMAQSKDEKWLFIVNLPQEELKQGVRVEYCRQPDQPCSYSDSFPLSVRTSCKQKYIFRQMLALAPNGAPTADSFKLPSCCACHTMSMGDAVSRMGVDPITQTPAPKRKKRRS